MWLILYVCNLVFALIVVIPLRGWLKGAVGHSMALTKSIGQFDFTFLTDLIRNHEGYSVLCSQALIIVIVYLIFSVFMSGGILHIYVHWREQYLQKEFIHGAAKYFWRVLRVSICFLLLQVVLLAILVFILMRIGIDPKEIESDVRFLQMLKWILPIYLFCATVVAIMYLYAKIQVIQQENHPVLKSLITGVRFVFRHFGKVLLLYVIIVMLFIGLFALYLFVRKLSPEGTTGAILLSFVLAQVFLVGRIVLKLLTISSANEVIRQVREVPESGTLS